MHLVTLYHTPNSVIYIEKNPFHLNNFFSFGFRQLLIQEKLVKHSFKYTIKIIPQKNNKVTKKTLEVFFFFEYLNCLKVSQNVVSILEFCRFSCFSTFFQFKSINFKLILNGYNFTEYGMESCVKLLIGSCYPASFIIFFHPRRQGLYWERNVFRVQCTCRPNIMLT